MTAFKVAGVISSQEWDGNYGPMTSYYVVFDGDPRTVQIRQKRQTPAPQVGQTVNGEITEDKPGKWLFKKEQQASFGGGGGGPRVEDPKRARAILRQHSQHMALLYMQASGQRPESWADFWKWVDLFDDDVEQAKEKA